MQLLLCPAVVGCCALLWCGGNEMRESSAVRFYAGPLIERNNEKSSTLSLSMVTVVRSIRK